MMTALDLYHDNFGKKQRQISVPEAFKFLANLEVPDSVWDSVDEEIGLIHVLSPRGYEVYNFNTDAALTNFNALQKVLIFHKHAKVFDAYKWCRKTGLPIKRLEDKVAKGELTLVNGRISKLYTGVTNKYGLEQAIILVYIGEELFCYFIGILDWEKNLEERLMV